MIRRIADWLRERRIRALHEHIKDRIAAGKRMECRAAWVKMVNEINARSAAQVARMERARGLRA